MRSSEVSDVKFMKEALRLARRGLYGTTPNPAVGAVIVRDGRIVGRGYHRRAGSPHAEREAIRDAGGRARSSDLYCTLEPCCTEGRTPPCTDAILASGIRRVVAGMTDPNPDVRGRGMEILKEAGVAVTTRVLEEDCARLNRRYVTAMTRDRPFVLLKWAASLDGSITGACGNSRWITGEEARRSGRRLRNLVDAILVGSETILADDPLLDRPEGRGPSAPLIRIVLDPDGRVESGFRIFREGRGPVWLIRSPQAPPFTGDSRSVCDVIRAEGNPSFDLRSLMQQFRGRGITSILVEGGGSTIGSFLASGLFDEGYAYCAPKLLGGTRLLGNTSFDLETAPSVRIVETRRIGPDLMVHWEADCFRE